jgi:HSP20 family protein
MDQKNIEVKLSNGSLIIKGEKKEDKEEKRKGYDLSERHWRLLDLTQWPKVALA